VCPEQTLPGIPFIQERASIKFSERGGYRVKALNKQDCDADKARGVICGKIKKRIRKGSK